MENKIKNILVSKSTSIISLIIITLVLGTTSNAQDKMNEIDEIFSWATPSDPGCVCAVSQNGNVIVNRAYGSADLEREVPLTPNSIFDAGSVTKQFVAAAVLILADEGHLSLSDDIRKYIPELPDYGHKIMIDHLLTHTSGIRDWTGLRMLSSEDNDAFTMILRQRGLNFEPGEEWSYSNSGYVLLKEIIARVSGMPFGEFAHKRLFEPLGMKSTSYRHDMRDVIKNRALAYEKAGDNWRLAILLDNDRGGGGGLLSTAGDLLIWNDALTNSRLGKFVTDKIHEQAKLNNGRQLGYARGLFIDSTRGSKLIWHGGSADGYKTILSRLEAYGLSIAILCNSGDQSEKISYARQILKLFIPDSVVEKNDKQEKPASADIPDKDLQSKSGLYFNELSGEPMRLVVNNGRLRIAGGPELVTVTKNYFRNPEGNLNFLSEDKFELHFLSPDQFELKSMEGKTTPYKKAQPYNPASDDLQAFTGKYESDEMNAGLQITAGDGTLLARLEHSPDKSLEFKPVSPDTFLWNRMMLRFVRDNSGRVIAVDYSNPLLRNIRFLLQDGHASR